MYSAVKIKSPDTSVFTACPNYTTYSFKNQEQMFAFAENIAIYHLFYVDTALCAVIYFNYRILQEVNRICTITASKKPFPYGQTAEKKK